MSISSAGAVAPWPWGGRVTLPLEILTLLRLPQADGGLSIAEIAVVLEIGVEPVIYALSWLLVSGSVQFDGDLPDARWKIRTRPLVGIRFFTDTDFEGPR